MSPTTEAPAKSAGHRKTTDKPNRHQPSTQTQGKGDESQKDGSAAATVWQVVPILVEQIEPSPYQPRLSFDPDEMNDLIASVRAKGVQQPIIVRTCKADREGLKKDALHNGAATKRNGTSAKRNGATNPNPVRYELIAGERRLRACKEAGRRSIPVIIRDDLTDAECAELALLENVQRSNLSVIEEARGYKNLMLQFRMNEERIAKKVGKSVGTIRDMLKLLQLPEPVQKLLAQKKLTASHGQELLRLVPFERVCVMVAERAVRDHLTATSLQVTLLPNVSELKRLGLLTELDYHTKFDWKNVCGQCPHKAYVTSGYGSYCLKPEEWKKKQTAAIELQEQEAARVMEEARQASSSQIEVDQLPPGSFRNLTHSTPPAGCSEQCPCRSEVTDSADPTKRIPICLDPNRYTELVRAERQAHEDARRQKYVALWHKAKDVLHADMESHDLGRLATILALPVLQAQFCRYVDSEQWESLARFVSANVGVFVPWDDLLDGEKEPAELYALLQDSFQTEGHLEAKGQLEVEEPLETQELKAQEQLQKQPPENLLLLCACLLLAYEANQAVRFTSDTPLLDFVLGHSGDQQPELVEQVEA